MIAKDIDLLTAEMRVGTDDPTYDLTADGPVGQEDFDDLVLNVLGTDYGDANLDGVVDGSDYTAWADHYGQSGGWADGDFSGDGAIDGADYTVWADHYGDSGVPAWADGGWSVGNFNDDGVVEGGDYTLWADNYAPVTSVPEPAFITVVARGLGGLLRVRRRGR